MAINLDIPNRLLVSKGTNFRYFVRLSLISTVKWLIPELTAKEEVILPFFSSLSDNEIVPEIFGSNCIILSNASLNSILKISNKLLGFEVCEVTY